MPEIGRITREQAASLAGLAPFDDASAEREGERHIAGGRARLRERLYAASLPAAMLWNPELMALYQRLTAAGKPQRLPSSHARENCSSSSILSSSAAPLGSARGDQPLSASLPEFLRKSSSSLQSVSLFDRVPFLRPDLPPGRTSCADAVKAGRRCAGATRSGIGRPCLDGGKHDVMLPGSRDQINGCYRFTPADRARRTCLAGTPYRA